VSQRLPSLFLVPLGTVSLFVFSALLALAQDTNPTSQQKPATSAEQPQVSVASQDYQPEAAAIRVRANMVEVGVVVRDAKGQPVPGLTRNNFLLFDQNKPQEISFFSVEQSPASNAAPAFSEAADGSAPPSAANSAKPSSETTSVAPSPAPAVRKRYIALFFDDFSMASGNFGFVQHAARQLVSSALGSNDFLGIFTTSGTTTVPFTNNKQTILDALGRMTPRVKMTENGNDSCTKIGPYQAYLVASQKSEDLPETKLTMDDEGRCQRCGDEESCYAAAMADTESVRSEAETYAKITFGALEQAVRALAHADGSRVLLLTSSGFLTAELGAPRDRLVDEALRSRVVIDSLDAKMLETDPPTAAGTPATQLAERHVMWGEERQNLNDVMDELAAATGGEFVHNSNDLSGAMQRMATETEVRYILGFAPPGPPPDGKFHVLKVKLTTPGRFAVNARRGYFDPAKPLAPAPPDEQQIVDNSVLHGQPVVTLAALTTTGIRHQGSTGLPELWVNVRIGLQGVQFVKQQDRSTNFLVFVSALFDQQGNFVAGKQGWMELQLTDAMLEQYRQTGVAGTLTMPVQPGTYRLREVVQEVAGGKISISDRPIEVR
jgi:VWFA-related protein